MSINCPFIVFCSDSRIDCDKISCNPLSNSSITETSPLDNGLELVVFDCGCEEHADRVEEYMRNNGYDKTKVVLSHNDSDHFDGIPYGKRRNTYKTGRIFFEVHKLIIKT